MKIFLISFKVQRVLLIQRDESEVTHHLFFGRMFRAWTNHKVNGKDHLKHRGLSPVLTALVKGYFSFFLWNLTDKPADRRFDLTRRFLLCQISQMAECCTACAVEPTTDTCDLLKSRNQKMTRGVQIPKETFLVPKETTFLVVLCPFKRMSEVSHRTK